MCCWIKDPSEAAGFVRPEGLCFCTWCVWWAFLFVTPTYAPLRITYHPLSESPHAAMRCGAGTTIGVVHLSRPQLFAHQTTTLFVYKGVTEYGVRTYVISKL